MAPQWMPQNLQKRLLLYILQQLSLFSEIDLPNLDVSLGSSSQVTLKDVEIDPDALQLPGIFLRDGKVSNLKLQLNMSGGVTIEGDGLELTMALASPNSSSFENSITEKSKFSLAQSTIDLAASVMNTGNDEEGLESLHDFQTPNQSFHESSNDSDKDQTSTLNNVMAKAVEAALARLQVTLTNISVRLIMDQATIDLLVEKVTFTTNDGVRSVDISDVTVIAVKPVSGPGEDQAKEDSPADKEQTTKEDRFSTLHTRRSKEDEEDDYEDNVSDQSDSDEDADNDEMMSSSILERPADLNSSLVYSKEEASSIYMSATSKVFTRRNNDDHVARVMAINHINVSFSGLSKLEDLTIEVDEVKIAATPVPNTLLYVLESLAILNLKDTIHRHSSLNTKLRQKKNISAKDVEESAKKLFESISANTIEISLVSSLMENGQFAKPEELRIIGKNFTLEQKDSDYMFGSLNKLSMLNNKDDILLQFDEDKTKNDIRFESKGKTSELTLLLSKNLEISLDQDTIQKFINITSLLPQILDSLHKLSTSKPIRKPSKSSVLFQNASTTINFKINETTTINACIYPISYDSTKGSLSFNKATLSRNDVPLVSLFKFDVDILAAEKQIRSFDNSGHEIVLTTPCFVKVDRIELNHEYPDLKTSLDSLTELLKEISFPVEEIRFKARKKTRISTNVMFQSRQSVKLQASIGVISLGLKNLHPRFGDVSGFLKNVTLLIYKDNQVQLHSMNVDLKRIFGSVKEAIVEPINIEDRSAPIFSAKIREPKNINLFLRNSVVEYYTKWLSIFDDSGLKDDSSMNSTENLMLGPSQESDGGLNVKMDLVDCATGLNPGRLSSKANLVIRNGTIDVKLERNIIVKSQLRSAVLVLIDDTRNILSLEDAKRWRNINRKPSWSQVSFLNSRGYSSVANINSLHLETTIKKDGRVNEKGGLDSMIEMDINADLLDIELCADSSQCLVQLINDLKQPVAINNDLKYRYKVPDDLNVFDDIDSETFKSTIDDLISPIIGGSGSNSEPLNIVDSYYDDNETVNNDEYRESSAKLSGSDILDKSLDELAIKDETLGNNPFFTGESNTDGAGSSSNTENKSDNSDSIILFNDGYFEDSLDYSINPIKAKNHPMSLSLYVNQISLKIYDGYDWKHTRKTINIAVKRLEKKAAEEKEKREESNGRPRRASSSSNGERNEGQDEIIGETLFDSIHVAFPINSDPSKLTAKINRDLQSKEPEIDDQESNGIDVGKNNIKKLKLRRSKFHKILIELHEVEAKFTIVSNNDPVSSSKLKNDRDYELLNEIDLKVADFEIIDNVPTSTWNKFVTSMKDTEREVGASMLSMNIKTIRPVLSLAATELLMDVHVLPLRLHVDQDTLELFTRFGEFKDVRFNLVDEFEDVIFIQKFQVNAVHIKLDYKPKKVDYAGLRSGHTTEFMNFFILDEADMILKKVKLYGVSGFPRLGTMLNGVWMPDIKSTQLSGVLAGLAPVRSIVQIGSGFKDLVVVPVKEYKKDGRVYRSFSKGVQHFTKNTTNELLKFGVKIAAGTQTLLEHTEQALGGNGASSRVSQEVGVRKRRTTSTNDIIYEEHEEDFNSEDEDEGPGQKNGLLASQLIGRSSLSTTPLQRSIYQPALESFVDLERDNAARSSSRHGGSSPRNGHKRDVLYVATSDFDQFEDDSEDESQRTISLYADQPTNLKEGFQLAYDSLGRHLLVAKDAIINAGTEIGDSGSAQDSTLAVVKATPVALIRPMIGATEAVSKALLGVTNQLDPEQRKYIDDKYKNFNKNNKKR
ncbi:unnamed protein product [Wickerhamomyces anomalus]